MFTQRPRHRYSKALALVTLATAILLPLYAIGIWFFWDALFPLLSPDLSTEYDHTQVPFWLRIVSAIVFLLVAAFHAFGFLGLRMTFLSGARNEVFSDRSLRGFKRFAWVSLIMVPLYVAQRSYLILVLSVSDPHQMGALSVAFSGTFWSSLFTGLLLLFLAHLFTEAKAAKDEIDQIV